MLTAALRARHASQATLVMCERFFFGLDSTVDGAGLRASRFDAGSKNRELSFCIALDQWVLHEPDATKRSSSQCASA